MIYSAPSGWEIQKRGYMDYALFELDQPEVKPRALHRDWQALAEMADKATYGRT